jgi:hypothetical protein
LKRYAGQKGEAAPKNGEEPVFVGQTPGRPLDQQAMLNRNFRKAAATFGAPKLGT